MLRRYALANDGKQISLDRFLADFSAAVATQRGHFVVASLMNAALNGMTRLPQQHLETAKNSLIHLFGRAPDQPGGLIPGRGGFTAVNLPGGDTDDTFSTFKTDGTWTGTGTDTTWVTSDTDTGTLFTAGGTVTGTSTVTDLDTWHTATDITDTDSTESDIIFSPDNYASITLIALSEYAQNLARTGALAVGARAVQ